LQWSQVQENVGDVQVAWITAIGDDTLTALVKEAQANNKDLQAAAANVERSTLLARQAGAALTPTLDLTTGAGQSGVDYSKTSDELSVGFQANWEIDVWGRIRAGEEAALANAESVKADYIYSQHSLAASTARAYFLAIEAGLQVSVAKKSVEALTKANDIVLLKYENGAAMSEDVSLSKSDLATAQANLIDAEGAQRDAIRSLEVLLGRYPGAELEVRGSMPDTPPLPPAGVPSDILERRPDLIAAERQVAAAFNRVDESKAARLPRIALTAGIGGSSDQLSNLLNPANVAWNVGTNLLAPIIDGGQRKTQVEISTAEQEQALAAYGQAALQAFQEVESRLDQSVVLSKRKDSLNEAATEINKALKVAELRYKEGEEELLDVLVIQQKVFTADSNLTTVKRAQIERWIDLNLALGGSWE
jgi:NodT family efflux transporter outer membrane factor (OMF) lipoprotein